MSNISHFVDYEFVIKWNKILEIEFGCIHLTFISKMNTNMSIHINVFVYV
jgi:hypothetical protein